MTPSDTARICTRKGQQRRRSEQQAAGKEGSQGCVSAAGSNLDETSSREEGGQRGGRLGQKEGRGRRKGEDRRGMDGWMDGRRGARGVRSDGPDGQPGLRRLTASDRLPTGHYSRRRLLVRRQKGGKRADSRTGQHSTALQQGSNAALGSKEQQEGRARRGGGNKEGRGTRGEEGAVRLLKKVKASPPGWCWALSGSSGGWAETEGCCGGLAFAKASVVAAAAAAALWLSWLVPGAPLLEAAPCVCHAAAQGFRFIGAPWN